MEQEIARCSRSIAGEDQCRWKLNCSYKDGSKAIGRLIAKLDCGVGALLQFGPC
jgi:hypothetical protein